MSRIFLFLLVICFLLPFSAVFAQEVFESSDIEYSNEFDAEDDNEDEEIVLRSEDFWFSFGGETAVYSTSGLAYGGSFSIGYGTKTSIGLKAVFFFNEDGITVLEINFLLRFYFFKEAYSGPFIQIMGGPSLYNREGEFSVPSTAGMISAGVSFGWRFVLFDRVFIEPSIRGGYPFIAGAAVTIGVRF